MKVAIIGYGVMGGLHHIACKQHRSADVVAAVNRGEEKRKSAKAAGVPNVYADHADMLERESPDLCILALPDRLHCPVALDCINAGSSILVEKPFATTVAEAKQMLGAANASGVKAAGNFTFRCEPDFLQLRGAIESKRFGDPKLLKIRIANRISVPTEMLSWSGDSSPTEFLMPHSIDLARWFLDAEVVSVRAFPVEGVLSSRGIDTHDAMVVVAQMSDGSTLILESSWILPNSFPSLVDFEVDLQGSDGGARLDRNETGTQFFDAGYERPINWLSVDDRGKGLGFFFESMARKLDWFAGNGPPETDEADAVANTAVLEAILEAARTGEQVKPASPAELLKDVVGS